MYSLLTHKIHVYDFMTEQFTSYIGLLTSFVYRVIDPPFEDMTSLKLKNILHDFFLNLFSMIYHYDLYIFFLSWIAQSALSLNSFQSDLYRLLVCLILNSMIIDEYS